MLTDLKMAPDGLLYGVQFGLFTQKGPVPESGAIVRVQPESNSAIVLDGLSFSIAIDFNQNGDAYITVGGVGPPESGSLIMVKRLIDREGE